MTSTNIDEDFHRWFDNEFADNIDEGSRTHTNLHSAFEAGAQSVKPQLDALYKSNEELRHILYTKDKEIERNGRNEGTQFRKNQETIGYP